MRTTKQSLNTHLSNPQHKAFKRNRVRATALDHVLMRDVAKAARKSPSVRGNETRNFLFRHIRQTGNVLIVPEKLRPRDGYPLGPPCMLGDVGFVFIWRAR